MTEPVVNPMRRHAPAEMFPGKPARAAAAVKRGDTTSLEAELVINPDVVHAVGKQGMTMLLWAASLQEVGCASVLLRHGADPNVMIKSGEQEFQVFALVAGGDNDSMFDLLLQAGADPNSTDCGEPALFNAIHARRWDRCWQMIDAGADINKPGRTGSPPVIYLAKINEWGAVADFIERGADVKAKDFGGATLADYVANYKLDRESANGLAHARVRRMLESRGMMTPTR